MEVLNNKPTDKQKELANLLGLDISNEDSRIGYYRIELKLSELFWNDGSDNDKGATQKQIEFAKKFGIDISKETSQMTNLIIGFICDDLNSKAIKERDLRPGNEVFIKSYNEKNKSLFYFTISSIKDGIVYFKGGNGARASARNVYKKI